MFLKIDFDSDKAIYMQLYNWIIMGIATDIIREEGTLPSICQMADYVGINMHAVSKAYSMLRREDFVKLDRRRGAVVSLGVDKIQATDDVREGLDVVLAWGVCKNINRDEVHHLADEIYDKCTCGCMGAEDGQGAGEDQRLPGHRRRLSVRIFRHILKEGQDRAVQKARARFWMIMESSYVM